MTDVVDFIDFIDTEPIAPAPGVLGDGQPDPLAGAPAYMSTRERAMYAERTETRSANADESLRDSMDEAANATPVAPLASPVLRAKGGAGTLVLAWDTIPDAGGLSGAGVWVDIHDVTDTGGVVDRDGGTTFIGTTAQSDFIIAPANGTRLYAAWARSTDLFAPAQSAPLEAAPDADAESMLVVNDLYAFNGVHAIDAATGARVDFTGKGIEARGPGGTDKTFSVDASTGIMTAVGAVVRGLGEFFSITIRGALTLLGLDNLIGGGSQLTVASGISTPRQKPTVDRFWPSVLTDNRFFAPELYRGLVLNAAGTRWHSTAFLFGKTRITSYNLDGTPAEAAVDLADNNFHSEGGITRIGTSFYVLGIAGGSGTITPRDGKWFVKRLNASFVETGEWEVAFSSSPPRRPAIGTNGTNVLIGRVAPVAGVLRMLVNEWNPTTGSYIGDAVTETFAVSTDVTSINVVGGRILVGAQRAIFSYRVSDGLRETATEFTIAGSAYMAGIGFDGARFRHLDFEGRLWTYAIMAADATRQVANSLYKSTSTGAGPQETDRGPAETFVQIRGSFMRVQTDAIYNPGGANDPDSVRIWIGGFRQADLGPGVTTALYEVPATGTTSKAPSFATSGSSAAKIRSGVAMPSGWELVGDGRAAGRTPQADDEFANKRYVDAGGLMATAALTKNGTQTVNGSQVLSAFTAEVQGAILTNAAAGSITIAETGWYDVSASIRYTGTATGRRYLFVVVDGVDVISEYEPPVSGADTWVTRSRSFKLTAGQVLTLRAQQDGGSSTATAGIGTYLTVTKTSA